MESKEKDEILEQLMEEWKLFDYQKMFIRSFINSKSAPHCYYLFPKYMGHSESLKTIEDIEELIYEA